MAKIGLYVNYKRLFFFEVANKQIILMGIRRQDVWQTLLADLRWTVSKGRKVHFCACPNKSTVFFPGTDAN